MHRLRQTVSRYRIVSSMKKKKKNSRFFLFPLITNTIQNFNPRLSPLRLLEESISFEIWFSLIVHASLFERSFLILDIFFIEQNYYYYHFISLLRIDNRGEINVTKLIKYSWLVVTCFFKIRLRGSSSLIIDRNSMRILSDRDRLDVILRNRLSAYICIYRCQIRIFIFEIKTFWRGKKQ